MGGAQVGGAQQFIRARSSVLKTVGTGGWRASQKLALPLPRPTPMFPSDSWLYQVCH